MTCTFIDQSHASIIPIVSGLVLWLKRHAWCIILVLQGGTHCPGYLSVNYSIFAKENIYLMKEYTAVFWNTVEVLISLEATPLGIFITNDSPLGLCITPSCK